MDLWARISHLIEDSVKPPKAPEEEAEKQAGWDSK
jgi:hypothetical protein